MVAPQEAIGPSQAATGLKESINNNGQTDAILLDFSKAFDRVSHQHLYYKLNHYGIRGKILDWLKQFLTGRSQCVIINGEQSDSTTVTSGVSQGTVLAPLLFYVSLMIYLITSYQP